MFQNIVHAQSNSINGTYAWDLSRYLTITNDSFKLYTYFPENGIYGLNHRDIILAEGKVEYESKSFIKLTSKNYERDANKNMTVIESIDSCLDDSIKFNFNFPFTGKYTIRVYFDNKPKYEVKNEKEVKFKANRDSIVTFSFTVLDQTPVKFLYHNYLKNAEFKSLYYTVKNGNSNSFDISIPDLTNSYFNRFLINGEYIKISKEKDVLFWHDEQYWKLGGFR